MDDRKLLATDKQRCKLESATDAFDACDELGSGCEAVEVSLEGAWWFVQADDRQRETNKRRVATSAVRAGPSVRTDA